MKRQQNNALADFTAAIKQSHVMEIILSGVLRTNLLTIFQIQIEKKKHEPTTEKLLNSCLTA